MAMNSIRPQARAGKPKAFSCPNCGGTVTVKAVGVSINAVCTFCSSVIDVSNDNFQILQTAHTRTKATTLTIGSKGALKGIVWEVIGYMEKTNLTGYYRWEEYLLYNPYHGFRFLLQSKGHWTLFKVQKRAITEADGLGDLKFDGKKYRRFEKTHTKVAYVKGEFYWRARRGEESVVTDYINPPYMVSLTKNNEEINLALGEYIDDKIIGKAFNVNNALPYRNGVAPNQPGRYTWEEVAGVWLTTLAALVLATFIQIISSSSADNATVYNNHFDIPATGKGQTLTTESFSLPKTANLDIESFSPLKDEWLELELNLVNEQDDSVLEGTQAMEFYSGMSYDGYYWAEGDQRTDSLFSAVPKGKYRLLIDADTGAFQKNSPTGFNITIKRDVSSWSNYWLTLLLLLIYPCYVAGRYKYTEFMRWSDSIVYEYPSME